MIRPATDADTPAMAQILSDWIDATPWMPRLYTRAEDMGFCARLIRSAQVWIADTRHGAGFLALAGDSIDALYLAPAIRGQGWGRALLDAVKPGQSRLSLWTFQANTRAIAFYQANGFRVTDVTNGQGNAEKLPDCRMIWERAPA